MRGPSPPRTPCGAADRFRDLENYHGDHRNSRNVHGRQRRRSGNGLARYDLNKYVMHMSKRTPDTVFTPRAAHVNPNMYVHRPKFETRLVDLFGGNKYIVIHGESGNGKTWLYKRVFSQQGVHYDVVNLGSIASAGSIEGIFQQKLGELGHADRTSEDSNTIAGIRPFGSGVE